MTAQFIDNTLHIEGVPVTDIVAQYGTPCYIYSRTAITQQWRIFSESLNDYPHRICYAVKANSNLAILNMLAKLGSGFDIVSGGELARVLAADGNPEKIVFSGVGKTEAEIKHALEVKIDCFNVESAEELFRIENIAKQLKTQAPIALRINPNIDAGTHPYISTGLKESKFGVSIHEAFSLYHYATNSKHLKIKGLACHIGSQITELSPFTQALEQLLTICDQLAKDNIHLEQIDIGGGLGVKYNGEQPPSPAEYCAAIIGKLYHRKELLIIEPGRSLVANAGFLITHIEYIKKSPHKNCVIVNAGMNDLLRPALYNAWQFIQPVINYPEIPEETYDVVGPICETGDFLGKDRKLKIKAGDLLAIHGCGAYGFSMSSNYNSHPRAAEVMVDGDYTYLVRERETVEELFAKEHII